VQLDSNNFKAFSRMGSVPCDRVFVADRFRYALQALGHLQAAFEAHQQVRLAFLFQRTLISWQACLLNADNPTYQIALSEAHAALEECLADVCPCTCLAHVLNRTAEHLACGTEQ
jgi:hypothetical protein